MRRHRKKNDALRYEEKVYFERVGMCMYRYIVKVDVVNISEMTKQHFKRPPRILYL